MFNTAPHNTQAHNSGTPGIPIIRDADTRQTILGYRYPLAETVCQQTVWHEDPHDVMAVQVVFAVLREETHIIRVCGEVT